MVFVLGVSIGYCLCCLLMKYDSGEECKEHNCNRIVEDSNDVKCHYHN